MANNTAIVIMVMLLLVGLCTASFFIGKGYANSKNEYVEGLASYGYSHCVVYDGSTDPNYHSIMNSSDWSYTVNSVCP